MMKNLCRMAPPIAVITTAWLALTPSLGQEQAPPASADRETPPDSEYKPPPRGAPGGRVGGASRGSFKVTASLPKIELLAPEGHAGLTTNPTPVLYFLASQQVAWPTQFTISAPTQPKPIVEVDIPAPRNAGVYGLRVADYHVRLEPGVLYTWSVSVILNPGARSRDVVASASLLRIADDPALDDAVRTAPVSRRAGLFARAGLWYDAVAAAAESAALGQPAALRALIHQASLAEPANYDLQLASGNRPR